MTRLALALSVCLAATTTANAFTIGTGFGTDGCHERITAAAYQDFLLQLPLAGVELPRSSVWKRVGGFLVQEVDVDRGTLDDRQFFLLTSLLVGVRSPDTEGHAVLNLDAVRALHTDPDPEGQYAHALRATTDDFVDGDLAAVAGTRAVIRSEIENAFELSQLPPEQQIEEVSIYFDFYGVVNVKVWGPAYHVGRAAHALQDSFSHTIRDEHDGLRTILTVLNFSEAVGGTLNEERDGLPHSASLDECGEATAGTFEAASRATRDLFVATRDTFRGRNPNAVLDVLDAWVRYRGGCTEENGFCDNDYWLDVLREEPSGPYLCNVGWMESAWGRSFAHIWISAIALLWWRRRFRWRSRPR